MAIEYLVYIVMSFLALIGVYGSIIAMKEYRSLPGYIIHGITLLIILCCWIGITYKVFFE